MFYAFVRVVLSFFFSSSFLLVGMGIVRAYYFQ